MQWLESLREAFSVSPDPPPKRLADFSPLWTLLTDSRVGFGVAVSFDLSVTAVLSLGGVDTSCKSRDHLDALSNSLSGMLALLPSGALVRFYSVELAPARDELAAYVEQFEPGSFARHLAEQKARQCAEYVAPRKRELFVAISTPPEFKTKSYVSTALGRRSSQMHAKASRILRDRMRLLRQYVDIVKSGLMDAGASPTLLDEEALFKLTWRLSNPMRGACFAPPRLRRSASLRSQLFLSGLRNHVDHIERENHFSRVVSLRVLPEAVEPGCIAAIQGFGFPHVLTVSVRRLDAEKSVEKLKVVQSQASKQRQLGGYGKDAIEKQEALANPPPEVARRMRDAREAHELIQAGDRVCEIAIQLLITASSREQLDRHTEKAIAAFRTMGRTEASVEEYRARVAYMGLLPAHHALVGDRYHMLLGSRAADLLPVFAPAKGASLPTYLLTTAEHTIFGWDPFDPALGAHNVIVVAATSRGKSVTVRLLHGGFYAKGGRGVVVTLGEDYHRYALLLGGEAYDVSLDDESLALGPFMSPQDLGFGTRRGAVRLEHLRSIMAVLSTEREEPLGLVASHLLYSALEKLYEQTPATEAPTLRDYLAVLETLDVADAEAETIRARLAGNLRFWVQGPYGQVFCRNRPPVEHKLTVWNLKPIGDENLQSVVLALLSGIIVNSIAAGPTLVTMDECWKLLSTATGSRLVASLFRTVRKEGSAVWAISQSIRDFESMTAESREGILTNSPIRIFLQHSGPAEIQRVAEIFGLNEAEVRRLAALRSRKGFHSDILLFQDETHIVLQLPITGSELWVATSDATDMKLEAAARRRYPTQSLTSIVKALGRRFPHGAAYGPTRRVAQSI